MGTGWGTGGQPPGLLNSILGGLFPPAPQPNLQAGGGGRGGYMGPLNTGPRQVANSTTRNAGAMGIQPGAMVGGTPARTAPPTTRGGMGGGPNKEKLQNRMEMGPAKWASKPPGGGLQNPWKAVVGPGAATPGQIGYNNVMGGYNIAPMDVGSPGQAFTTGLNDLYQQYVGAGMMPDDMFWELLTGDPLSMTYGGGLQGWASPVLSQAFSDWGPGMESDAVTALLKQASIKLKNPGAYGVNYPQGWGSTGGGGGGGGAENPFAWTPGQPLDWNALMSLFGMNGGLPQELGPLVNPQYTQQPLVPDIQYMG